MHITYPSTDPSICPLHFYVYYFDVIYNVIYLQCIIHNHNKIHYRCKIDNKIIIIEKQSMIIFFLFTSKFVYD